MKKKLLAIFENLGLTSKVEKKEKFTKEEWDQVAVSYKEEHGTDLDADLKANAANAAKAQAHDKSLELVAAVLADSADPNNTADPNNADDVDDADLVDQVAQVTNSNKELKTQVVTLQGQVETLSGKTTPDEPNKTVDMKVVLGGAGHTASHAFGIEHSMFDATKRWNQALIDMKIPDGEPSSDQEDAFKKETRSYGEALSARMQVLHSRGLLTPAALKLESDLVGYGDLSAAGLGEQYIVRRQDALIARIIELPTVKNLFPVRYGVQDQELITNAFFGEFSQAFQESETFKGSVSLQPEKGYVDDAMLKTKFESLKWIERQYVGYLNSNGSDPIKWNMIEWMLINIATKLTKEQNERNVMGIYRKPLTDKAGHALHSATGVLYTLLRYYHERKIKLFDAANFATYDTTTMLSVVENFVEEVKKYLPSITGMAIYLNANHKKWYAKKFRSEYGTDVDFKGIDMNKIQDDEVEIIWVPNMGQTKFIWMTNPGNVQLLEFQPGEMFKMKFEQRMHVVLTWSVWKEGASAAFVGKRFTTFALLDANAYADQVLFMNKPITALADDAVTCDGTANFWFQSIENTTADKVITDITGAKQGVGYIIETGHATNPQKVDKALKFSEITVAYVPVAIGDYLMVVWNAETSKFYEMERCVNGVRTINALVQPNMPA